MSIILNEMESRNSWGIVYVAAAFAIVIIGATLMTVYLQKKQNDAQVASIAANLIQTPVIADTASSSLPDTMQTSQTVSSDLFNKYSDLLNNGSFTAQEVNQASAAVAKADVQPAAVVPNISLADLNVKDGAPVSTYLQLLSVIMSQSSQVQEYEVSVFSRSVTNDVTTGTPTLADDAALYRRIAAALLIMEVPKSLATEHLDLVKSVGALGNAVADMASWKGDPVEALVYIDAFNKAESYVQNSVDTLLATAKPLVAQKS